MRKNNYYFVARNIDTNQFKILRVYDERCTSLETIDLATTKFVSLDALIQKMYQNHIIDSLNTDLFITYRNSNGRSQKMKFLEPVFLDQSETLLLRNVAEASKKGDLNNCSEVDGILNAFCRRMQLDSRFHYYVMTSCTNLYSKFLDYFKGNNASFYSSKYKDGGWVQKSYPLLRNIIETFHRFDFGFTDYSTSRNRLQSSLLEQTDKSFVVGQMNVFDYLREKESKELEASEQLARECEKIEKHESEKQLTSDDKRSIVMDTFSKLDYGTFVKSGKCFHFNEKLFSNYEDEDLSQLNSLLPRKLAGFVYLYVIHYHHLKEDEQFGKNTMEIQREVDLDRRNILKQLKEPEKLEGAYQWCLLYNKYRNKVDNNGKEYTNTRRDSNES